MDEHKPLLSWQWRIGHMKDGQLSISTCVPCAVCVCVYLLGRGGDGLQIVVVVRRRRAAITSKAVCNRTQEKTDGHGHSRDGIQKCVPNVCDPLSLTYVF